jgi:protein SCO1/2
LSARRLAALLVPLAVACGASDVYTAHGVVREVDRAERQAVIEHEDIPGLMPAMTMSFDVPDDAVLARLEPGDRIEFELQVREKSYRVISARAQGERAGAARAPLVAAMARQDDPAPDFSLVDQHGARVSLADLRGRTLLVDFVYTQCNGPCPILTGLHAELQRSLDPALRERVRFVSISLDPENDTPEALAKYGRERGADLEGWSFLTGPKTEVEDVVRRYGVGTLRAADGTIDHLVATFLVDANGRIARRWLGLDHTVDEMRAEIARVAGAAPAGS